MLSRAWTFYHYVLCTATTTTFQQTFSFETKRKKMHSSSSPHAQLVCNMIPFHIKNSSEDKCNVKFLMKFWWRQNGTRKDAGSYSKIYVHKLSQWTRCWCCLVSFLCATKQKFTSKEIHYLAKVYCTNLW